MPTRAETEITKNYLSEKELDLLNRMVSAYLDVAEINDLNMHSMTMKDWVKELEGNKVWIYRENNIQSSNLYKLNYCYLQ